MALCAVFAGSPASYNNQEVTRTRLQILRVAGSAALPPEVRDAALCGSGSAEGRRATRLHSVFICWHDGLNSLRRVELGGCAFTDVYRLPSLSKEDFYWSGVGLGLGSGEAVESRNFSRLFRE